MTQTTHPSALRLLTEILTAYGTMDLFLAQARRELDYPTEELPRFVETTTPPWRHGVPDPDLAALPVPPPTGRHARADD
ncbi:hypothetical protein [Nocardia sp. NPDC005978]|uniref:hypothetical protein n=1 Tax=unclassified Nocardia TaxID=2637762 RepID=UPI0033A2FC3B